MSPNVQGGVVQIALAIGLLYAFWSGALAVLLEGIGRAIRGEDPGTGLLSAATAGRPAGGGNALVQ